MINPFPLESPPKNICILRLSAIGDVCLLISTVQRIQAYWPNTKITWVIAKNEAALLEGLPGIEFIIFDKKGGLKSYFLLFQAMKGRYFDILLHTQVAIRASLVSLIIPARFRVGYDRKRATDLQWLFTNLKIPHIPNQHMLEIFHGFADYLGIPKTAYQWHIPINEVDEIWAQQIINPTKRTLVITPGSSVPSRIWTAEGYAEIANYAIKHHKMDVILCGGTTSIEQTLAEKILSLCPKIQRNLIGKTTLKQLLALLKNVNVLVAPDTGPAHMATMFNTPVIGLYANTNPDRAGPYFSQKYVVNRYPETMKLRYKTTVDQLAWGKRCHDGSMMKLISPSDVMSKLDDVLKDSMT